jgi:hypothetical protein
VEGEVLRFDLDALPGTGSVAVGVLRTGSAILHSDVLDPHGVRVFIVVGCNTSSPFNGAVGLFRVTTGPDPLATSVKSSISSLLRTQT